MDKSFEYIKTGLIYIFFSILSLIAAQFSEIFNYRLWQIIFCAITGFCMFFSIVYMVFAIYRDEE